MFLTQHYTPGLSDRLDWRCARYLICLTGLQQRVGRSYFLCKLALLRLRLVHLGSEGVDLGTAFPELGLQFLNEEPALCGNGRHSAEAAVSSGFEKRQAVFRGVRVATGGFFSSPVRASPSCWDFFIVACRPLILLCSALSSPVTSSSLRCSACSLSEWVTCRQDWLKVCVLKLQVAAIHTSLPAVQG